MHKITSIYIPNPVLNTERKKLFLISQKNQNYGLQLSLKNS